MAAFRVDYGPKLEIFDAKLYNDTCVQLVMSIPGDRSIVPETTHNITSSDEKHIFSQPELESEEWEGNFNDTRQVLH